jgi:tol-pal system protein YbgF
VAAGPAAGADRRAAKAGTDEAIRQNLLDIVQQLDTLQTEVRQLRNSVEVQGHELEQLKTRQRALYDDLDQRLRESEKQRAAAPAAAAAAAPTVAADVPVSRRVTTPAQQQEYDAAFNLMKVGQYDKAVKAFRAFLAKHPDSGLADNAQYWIAEGNYVLRNYKLALEEFTKVLDYPQSTKAPDAQLKIGYVHYELGAYDKARKALTEAQQHYPGTTVAKLAAARLEKMAKEGR